jgi:hypothetical protein
MKKIIYTLSIVLGLAFSANAQIQSLAGPRLGVVYISASPASAFLNGDFKIFKEYKSEADVEEDYDNIANSGALTSLYGWQFESRFADGGNITGIVEWIVLVAGMERGKFLPSVSSMVGARTASGLEFAVGPNLSLANLGISMVLGVGYNFKVGKLNMPVNFAFVPGNNKERDISWENEGEVLVDPDGIPNNGDEYSDWQYEHGKKEVTFNTGHRFSITCGFNLNK